MSAISRTYTFTDGTTAYGSQVETEISAIVTAWNNHNAGTSAWEKMNVTSTATNPVTIISSGATTEVAIDNTATDGDPILSFKLSGTSKFVMGVDDGDSDFLKCGTTAIGTATAMQIPTTGVQVQFALGSATVPGVSFIGRTTQGVYSVDAASLGFTVPTGGSFFWLVNSAEILRLDGSVNSIWSELTTKTMDMGLSSKAFDDMYADDFNNVADIPFFDFVKDKDGNIQEIDDVEIVKAIQPQKDANGKVVFNENGHAFWDDSTLPEWIFHKDKRDRTKLVRDADGKPWVSMKVLAGLALGAVAQLTERVEALESK